MIILYYITSLILHTHQEFSDSPEFAYPNREDHPCCEEPEFSCLVIISLILIMLSSLLLFCLI